MNTKTKAIRALILEMPPVRRIEFVNSFELTEEEVDCLLLREVRGKFVYQTAQEKGYSPETIKRRRKSAFSKIYKTLYPEQ